MGTDTRPMQHGPYSRVFKSKSGRKGERKIAGKRKDGFIYDLVVLLSSFYLWFGAASARQKMRHHRIYTERHNGLYYGVQSHCISFYNWNHTLLYPDYNIHIISIISPLSWLTCLYSYTECIPFPPFAFNLTPPMHPVRSCWPLADAPFPGRLWIDRSWQVQRILFGRLGLFLHARRHLVRVSWSTE